MGWLSKAGKLIQRLTFYVCALSMFMLIPMMLLTTTDILARTFFTRPIPGAVELSEYMLVVVILMGLAYTHQVKGHPTITLVVSRFPLKVRLVLEILVSLLGMFIIFIVIWQGWVLATGRMAAVVSDVLRIPQLPFRLLVSAGAILLFLELLVELIAAAAKLTGIFPKGHAASREQEAGKRKQ
ncbi:MAG: TRAP transporter small permease [Firmicutes bacterium]|nr:TRAP transporter small permease [Bacillota bacterium]